MLPDDELAGLWARLVACELSDADVEALAELQAVGLRALAGEAREPTFAPDLEPPRQDA
jgi:hypothetical protein